MDTHEALRTRRTAHSWTPKPVPDAVIQRALEAAHLAPCHKMTWPWRFTLPGSDARDDLLALGLRLAAEKYTNPLSKTLEARVIAKLRNPALIVVSQIRDDDPFRSQEDYAACACAIQNISLSVHADGFHSKWSTGKITRHPETYQRLGIDEVTEQIIGFVWVGEPSKSPSMPKRVDRNAVIRYVS